MIPEEAEECALALITFLGWQPFHCSITAEHSRGVMKGDVTIHGDTWFELSWKVRVADTMAGRTFLTASEYRELFGHYPEQDALQRVTCPKAGAVGHFFCGVCLQHAAPCFMCGCQAKPKRREMDPSEEWRNEFLSCKHVHAGTAESAAYTLIEVNGSRDVTGARVCAACVETLRAALRAEPIGGVERKGGA